MTTLVKLFATTLLLSYTLQGASGGNPACVASLESCIGDATKFAEDIGKKKLIKAIGEIGSFVSDFESKAKGSCKHVSLYDIKDIIKDSQVHAIVKECLLDITNAVIDAKKFVHDFKAHKILHIIHRAHQVQVELVLLRRHCSRVKRLSTE